ncbi:MAG: hypothetical protein K0R72_1005 [Clostridia bacterium]|jgi:hypothetical protein|nr:hypothetical protein [Clostridia bacterium]
MGIVAKHFLVDSSVKHEKFQGRCTDVFVIFEDFDLVDSCICAKLSEEIGAEVYWYKSDDRILICVMEENVDAAIVAGKKLIIQNMAGMTAQYIEKTVSLVLDDYSIIATFETDDIAGLADWCKNIDTELVVKTNLKGERCVLTKEPLEFTSRIKSEYASNPFPTLLNFDFFKI